MDFERREEVKLLKRSEEIRTFIEELIPQVGSWDTLKATNPEGYQGKLFYKSDSSSGKLQVVTEIYLPWKMSEIAALVYEADLTPDWVKASDRQIVTLNSNPVPFVVSFQNLVSLPWPLDDRWGNSKGLAFVGEGLDAIT